jgi:predicted nuclease of predicted toxin-antitoxin system
MAFLVDANISWRLLRAIDNEFPGSIHVNQIQSVPPLTDMQIWDYAKSKGLVILSNDDDFYKLSVVLGYPPKVILLRKNNQKTDIIAKILLEKKERINLFILDEDVGIIEIY